jgi:SAM-dependent methyltransferase
MTTFSNFAKAPVLAAYDFSPFSTIVDVGAGHGALLAEILQRTPTARGVLFDLPSVTTGAADMLRAHGVETRCTIESGSFFDRVPAEGDAYVLKNIIHNWEESNALTILRNIREVIKPDGRLLLIELVLPEGNSGHLSQLMNLEMLLDLGGRERTEPEYREFLSHAGFELTRVGGADRIAGERGGVQAHSAVLHPRSPWFPSPCSPPRGPCTDASARSPQRRRSGPVWQWTVKPLLDVAVDPSCYSRPAATNTLTTRIRMLIATFRHSDGLR